MKFKTNYNVAMLDILLNLTLIFAALFILAYMLINPITKKSDIERKAEFLVVLTWPDDNIDDIDLWVKDPLENRIGFRTPEIGVVHLERDDLGIVNDHIQINGESVVIQNNTETIAIRGIIPGAFYISVHYYDKKDNSNLNPVPITVEFIKVNPYKLVYKITKEISIEGEAINFPSVTIDSDGHIVSIEDTSITAVGTMTK